MTSTGIRSVVYRFEDAPVPPEHHRSFTVQISPGAAQVSVDCYGEILAVEAFPLGPADFEEVLSSLSRCRIRRGELGEDEECTGGTAETISWTDGSGSPFSATVYHCGGRDTGSLSGDVAAFAAGLRRLLPGLGRLL